MAIETEQEGGRPLERRLADVEATPMPAPGFMGHGHTVVPVVEPGAFGRTDPFILLMDDRVDRRGGPFGSAHPHAGFETVTLMLDGRVSDRAEGILEAGDVLWMTAGSGVIHNEDVTSDGDVRLLQLWLTLPKSERWVPPAFWRIPLSSAPVRREPGVQVRVYSGRSGSSVARARPHVPVTLLDIEMGPDATLEQDLPACYRGLVYGLAGSALVGSDARLLEVDQVGWLDRPHQVGPGTLRIRGGEQGVRMLLYAGEPTNDPIVPHGPFVGDTQEDIIRLYGEYETGRFPRMSELSSSLVPSASRD